MQSQSITQLINELNENHSSEIGDVIDVFKSQRDYVKVQRLHEAKVTSINEHGMNIECLYHLWEKEEQVDRFFQHKVTDTINVFFDWPDNVKPGKFILLILIKLVSNRTDLVLVEDISSVKNAVNTVIKAASDVVAQGFQF